MKYYFIQVYNHLSLALVIYLNIKSEINIALPFAICICQSLPLLVAISIKLSKQETIHKRTMAKAKAQTPSSVPHLVSGSSNLAPRKATPSQAKHLSHFIVIGLALFLEDLRLGNFIILVARILQPDPQK